MRIAVVTGASSGLGAAFARALTTAYEEFGLDEIWLIARRRERLEAMAAANRQVLFRVLDMDLTDEDAYTELAGLLQETQPEIRVLINNAGYQSAGAFAEVAPADVDRMIDVNVLAATRVQRLCTPYLAADSISILTASVLAYVPTPGQAVYGATKAYLYALGRALREEYRGSRHGNVLVLCPGSMDTEMNPRERNANAQRFPFLYTDVDRIAVTALRKAARGAGVYTPGAFYKTWRVVAGILPHELLIRVVGGVYRTSR